VVPSVRDVPEIAVDTAGLRAAAEAVDAARRPLSSAALTMPAAAGAGRAALPGSTSGPALSRAGNAFDRLVDTADGAVADLAAGLAATAVTYAAAEARRARELRRRDGP